MARKGHGLGWRGVCLLQGYCPFCFKGEIGKACGKRVPSTSRQIDEVQALHAKRGNGLCVLDLQSPGDFCANPSLCKLVCLVCGKGTVHGEDPAFEIFRNACCEDADRPSRYELEDAMDEHDLVWTEQWDTPVHARCANKAPCKCVVPLGATMCPTHKRPMVVKRAPVAPVKNMPPAIVAKGQPARASKVVLEKAAWLKTPSLTSQAYVSGEPAQVARPCKKPQPKKPNVKLEAAAEKCCSYKINSWAVSKMEDPSDTTGKFKPKPCWKFDFKKHQDDYDPYSPDHGYRQVDGVWMYRFPDGRLERAGTVNEITPGGRLIPLCF